MKQAVALVRLPGANRQCVEQYMYPKKPEHVGVGLRLLECSRNPFEPCLFLAAIPVYLDSSSVAIAMSANVRAMPS